MGAEEKLVAPAKHYESTGNSAEKATNEGHTKGRFHKPFRHK